MLIETLTCILLILVEHDHILHCSEDTVLGFQLDGIGLEALEQELNVVESFWDIDGVVSSRGHNSVKLLAINGQRHFDIFDLLDLRLGQKGDQFCCMLKVILLGYN